MFLLVLAACTDDKLPETGTPADGPTYEDPDGNVLVVGSDGGLRYGDRLVTLAIGEVATPDDTVNYDPWNVANGEAPSGFHWRTATAAVWDGEAWQLTLQSGWTATLAVDDTGPGARLTLTPTGDTWAPYVRVTVAVEPDEGFYGLGEWFDGAEHRGHVHPMQILAEPSLESVYNEAHVPVPLLVSTASWGILADSYYPGVFDVAASDPDAVAVMFNQQDGFSFDLYGPSRPVEVLSRYHTRTGPPEVPPDWAFAPLQWRDEGTAADVLEDAAAIRANGIPGGCTWIDNPWQTDYNSMIPDEEGRYPDWDGMIATLEAQGFRMLTWTTPYIEEGAGGYDTYAANGWFVDLPIEFNQFGPLVDLTNPDAAADWELRVDAAEARGIHGWKLDYGEDVQVGIGESRLATTFANGQDERTMHHNFVTAYHAPYADGGDAFLLGRSGVLGGHTITDAIWPGDLDSDFRVFGEDGHVGGLPSAIRAATGLAASGYHYFASDTGGYRHDRPTEEILLRWTEYAALLPIFQYGGSGQDHNPWNFEADGDSVYTATTLDDFRRYAVLHTRLFPYFKLLSERAVNEGLPVIAARGLGWPEDGVRAENQFFVGDDLLVAAVEAAGVEQVELTLPPGGWVHWWTGQRYEGDVTVPAPLGAGPLFQREGSAIPLLRPEIMTLAATDGSVESWADNPGVLHTRVVPGDGAGFVLASGEALTWLGDTATLTAGSTYTGWELEVWGDDVSAVAVNGAALPVGTAGCTECWYAEDPWIHVVTSGTVVVFTR